MSLYLVPKCVRCHRLFPQFAQPDQWGAENALRQRLRESGWQASSLGDYCPECLAALGEPQKQGASCP